MPTSPRRTSMLQRGLGTMLVLASGGWLACSSVEDKTAKPASDDGGVASPDSRTNVDAAVEAEPRDAATSDDAPEGGAAPSPACITYCNTEQALCTVDYPQFGSMHACLLACSFYPPGTAADDPLSGNTLKCRQTHAESYSGHCLHAGPYGYGGCGSMCEGFCQLAMGWCAGATSGAPFASAAACKTECESWAWAPSGADPTAVYSATSPTTGNTLECREVQLTKALESTAARDIYCPLAATNSAPCR